MHSRWQAIEVLHGLLLGIALSAPAHASIICIHTETRGMVSLVDHALDSGGNEVADAVFQKDDDWSNDGEVMAEEASAAEEEAAAEVSVAATEFPFVDGAELAGVESSSAVPLPAVVWLFGSGLLLLASSGGKRRKS